MSNLFALVAAHIREELENIEQVVARAEDSVKKAQSHPEMREHLLDAAALNVHDFYIGLEHIFHRIASSIDRSVPTGEQWHRELLRQMAVPLPSVRPQVLSEDTTNLLGEYLGFRHVVRNVYTFRLKPERVELLVKELPLVFARARDDLLDFVSFLEKVNGKDE